MKKTQQGLRFVHFESEEANASQCIRSYLQNLGELARTVVQRDVQRILTEFTLRVDVGSEAQQKFHHVSVSVLHGPVQSAHLKHVLSIHVCPVL